MTRSRPLPSAVAHQLGYLATLPFLVGAALVFLVDAGTRPGVRIALSDYAAVVVAFIGAIHWGIAFTRTQPALRSFAWGVVPSLVAWAALLSPPRIGLGVHAATLAACYVVDRATYPVDGVASWLPLRLRLTVVAASCCVVATFGS